MVDLLFPLQCAGCGRAGTDWCSGCAGSLGGFRRVHREVLVVPAFAVGRYRGSARDGLLAFKEAGQRGLAVPFGRRLATGLRAVATELGAGDRLCLIPAPSRRRAARRRGGPHVTALARRAAAELSAEGWSVRVADCLYTASSAADSVGMAAADRMRNLVGRVRVRPRAVPAGPHVAVLVDDVITTGATAAAAVDALAAHGVRVRAVLALTATAG
nr:ComF family protein [Saccharopolyspora sp. HNM0983]